MAPNLSPLLSSFGVNAGTPITGPSSQSTTSPASPPTGTQTSQSPVYSGKNPPPGFTADQWRRLIRMSKNNPSIFDLMNQYTKNLSNGGSGGSGGGSGSGSNPVEDAWRRVMPTNTSQLMKQLSYNVGETGMPQGYVGAIQLPAYGETQPPVNNPDMSKYGQASGLGEATFYQQSIKGGMTPIAAMSPLGVPADWNPGGSSNTDTKTALDKYLKGLNGKGAGAGSSPQSVFQSSFEDFMKNQRNGGFNGVFAGFGAANIADRRRAKKKANENNNNNNNNNSGDGNGTGPGDGIPISLPYGY